MPESNSIFLVRTRTETFKGFRSDCEDWLIERRFPMFEDEFWSRAEISTSEWPGRIGELAEVTVERSEK